MKRALVTGGSGAIGAAICRSLARDGAHIYVHANSQVERAENIAGEIRAAGGSAHAIAFDITDSVSVEASLSQLIDEGPIQILVNNAGLHDDAVMADMSAEKWQRVIDVSLNGFFNVTRPLLMPMIEARWGRIINISSVSAITGNRGQVNYAAAKAGLHGAAKSLALELASRRITVNTVAPGIIASGMAEGRFTKEAIERLVPMKRAGTADEVASLVAFLASDSASYISGQIIGVNGAMI